MRYAGQLNGQPATLEARLDGGVWRGRAEVAGRVYGIEGYVVADRVQGLVEDTATGEQAALLARLDDDGVSFELPVAGRLRRGQAQSPQEGPAPQAPAGQQPQQEESSQYGSVDPRLVGSWLWTDSSTGSGPVIVLQERLILRADGTFTYGDAKVAGGGDGIAFDGGEAGGSQSGKWRTGGSWIYVDTGVGYQKYAKYQTDGESLLLHFLDGTSRLWKRAGAA